MVEQIQDATSEIRRRSELAPAVGLILGSGLGGLADTVQASASVPYADIPGFPRSTAPGHTGRLVVGVLEGKPVVAMVGRVHLYEGYAPRDVTFGVRLMAALGVRTLIVTNAAGGVNIDFHPGTLMVIADHINLMGHNPLVGPNDKAIGPRFPDMSEAYTPALRRLAHDVADRQGVELQEGVYVAFMGPSYETPAEIRMTRTMGADAVGMSTVPEVIVASHAGLDVLGISCITNMAAGILPQRLTEEEVLQTAERVRDEFSRLVRGIVAALPD